MQKRGQLVMVANSRYDEEYIRYFSGLDVKRIPSLCAYIDDHTPKCTRVGTKFLSFGEHAGGRECANQLPDRVRFVRDVLGQYRHDEIIKAKGTIWFPYNVNAMSFFEHYWLEIPLFVPSMTFMRELYDKKLAGQQMSWHRGEFTGSNLPAADRPSMPDPNTRDGFEKWMSLWDFYDTEEFPFVNYFHSWDHLRWLTDKVDYEATSEAMRLHNIVRRRRNLAAWAEAVR
jgi:hypothetical protein